MILPLWFGIGLNHRVITCFACIAEYINLFIDRLRNHLGNQNPCIHVFFILLKLKSSLLILVIHLFNVLIFIYLHLIFSNS